MSWDDDAKVLECCVSMHGVKSSLTTLILNALLNPLAKKPPNGPIRDANRAKTIVWTRKGWIQIMGSRFRILKTNANGLGASYSLKFRPSNHTTGLPMIDPYVN